MLARIGARVWIARIMFTWGVLSTAMIFVDSPARFYVLRFLLGAAEAGFFPGHHPLPDAVVPAAGTRARRRAVHDGDGHGRRDRRAALERVAADGRHLGTARVAMAVH